MGTSGQTFVPLYEGSVVDDECICQFIVTECIYIYNYIQQTYHNEIT